LITASLEVPEMVAFIQPILLIIAISLYTTAISTSNLLTRPDYELFPDAATEEGTRDGAQQAPVERTLDLPEKRTEPGD